MAEHIDAHEYYSTGDNAVNNSTLARMRSFSQAKMKKSAPLETSNDTQYRRRRRGSHDDLVAKPRKFLIDVEETLRQLVAQEDTDGDFQITVDDVGPKVIKVGTAGSDGFLKYDIRGTYMLSNLLQELALANDYGRKHIVLDERRLNENPVTRLSRMIRQHFWNGLTRRIDAEGLEIICADPKNRSANHQPRIYVPFDEDEIYEYYKHVADTRPHLQLDVQRLPEDISPQYVKSINTLPGILALAMRKVPDSHGNMILRGVPFVVPGGRFNEMYGWDSYFESLGLIVDGRVDLGKDMVDNFIYEIKHYGKILNANRSYYLTRSQPPFLTDMALKVYERLPADQEQANKEWLATAIVAAIKEYHTVWMTAPRLDPKTGLSCFHPTGIGMPPETEASHFDHIVEPYANALGVDILTYQAMYNDGRVKEPRLDAYFTHDRGVRESGHDTTYRLEKKCADLATVDLQALLYKYEMDIGRTIRDVFNDRFEIPLTKEQQNAGTPATIETSEVWFERARTRTAALNKYCWNEEKGLYFDYDTRLEEQSVYESVTNFYALWAGCASEAQAAKLMEVALPKFEVTGGLVCGTEESRGKIALDRPNRQWDYPFGWAPHQIMAWQACRNYGYEDVARRLAYRWLYTITKAFVDFNGVVPEKFDIVSMSHQVKVEYGNVGVDFKYIPREGFGWMNASFQVGLTYLTTHMRRALGALTDPDRFFSKSKDGPGRFHPSSTTGSTASSLADASSGSEQDLEDEEEKKQEEEDEIDDKLQQKLNEVAAAEEEDDEGGLARLAKPADDRLVSGVAGMVLSPSNIERSLTPVTEKE